MSTRPIIEELAQAYGIATSYHAASGEQVIVSTETLVYTLEAMGVPMQDPEASLAAKRAADAAEPIPPTIVAVNGQDTTISVHVLDGKPAEVSVQLEAGGEVALAQVDNWNPPQDVNGVLYGEASFLIPASVPLGWHTASLHTTDAEGRPQVYRSTLVVVPEFLRTTRELLDKPAAGVMAQLYSVRSAKSWGMGDFADLGQLAEVLAQGGADYVLINPLHAAEAAPPVEDSPYLPTTRRFLNPIYLRIEDIPEYDYAPSDMRLKINQLAAPLQTLNRSAEEINRNPIYAAKLEALSLLYTLGLSGSRKAAYEAYLEAEGQGLHDFATWCAANGDQSVDFYRWLQFLCFEQMSAAQARAKAAGMRIGIMADLAVGVHPGGADAQNLSPVLSPKCSVGAPPDMYAATGQDWSQPPWNPRKLAETGYAAWRDMLRSILATSGGIRVDHILGLFRLWWIPRCQPATTGTYVYYDHKALVGILALEAQRAGAVVIGEDLGTFENWVQDVLASFGIIGTSVVWFEHDWNGPRAQQNYRQLAITSVGTHDLPPAAGYLAGDHIELRSGLGLLARDYETEEREDRLWQNQVLDQVAQAGCFADTNAAGRHFGDAARANRGDLSTLMLGLHRFIAGTPSILTCACLTDLVGDRRTQNQPGTVHEQYPNWCVPLTDINGGALLIEDLPQHEMFQQLLKASLR